MQCVITEECNSRAQAALLHLQKSKWDTLQQRGGASLWICIPYTQTITCLCNEHIMFAMCILEFPVIWMMSSFLARRTLSALFQWKLLWLKAPHASRRYWRNVCFSLDSIVWNDCDSWNYESLLIMWSVDDFELCHNSSRQRLTAHTAMWRILNK